MNNDLKAVIPPMFVGDHLALDFLNTVATLDDASLEWMGSGIDLLGWLRAVGAVTTADEAVCRRSFSMQALNDVAREARELRDWFRTVVRKNAGRAVIEITSGQLSVVNQLLEQGQSYFQITREAGHGPALGKQRRWTDARQLLQPIAEGIADLVCNADWRLVRACGGNNCTLFFLDRTKAHRRRWCSMAVCGNRHKVATHRARIAEGD